MDNFYDPKTLSDEELANLTAVATRELTAAQQALGRLEAEARRRQILLAVEELLSKRMAELDVKKPSRQLRTL